MTGSGVIEATMPGRWAAPPAPAMTILMPRRWAEEANSIRRCGVRCAETMVTSTGMSKDSRNSAAARMTGRSLSEPMMTLTTGGC